MCYGGPGELIGLLFFLILQEPQTLVTLVILQEPQTAVRTDLFSLWSWPRLFWVAWLWRLATHFPVSPRAQGASYPSSVGLPANGEKWNLSEELWAFPLNV